eukprot:SAG22_NODE_5900_length_934_cov_1.473054_1_plen_93_part_00
MLSEVKAALISPSQIQVSENATGSIVEPILLSGDTETQLASPRYRGNNKDQHTWRVEYRGMAGHGCTKYKDCKIHIDSPPKKFRSSPPPGDT